MYFGSVKFFKTLILTVVFGWIGVATVLAVFFAVKCHMLSANADAASDTPVSPEEYIAAMKEAGYTAEDILNQLSVSDKEALDAFIGTAYDGIPVSEDIPAETLPPDTFEEAPAGISAEEVTSVTVPVPQGNYSDLYPELTAVPADSTVTPDSKTVYLTFDDGPSSNTYDILYILEKHHIKATFFMSGGKTEQSREQMAAVAEAGHSIGVHSFSHSAEEIYSSVENFLADFYETYKLIYDAIGVMPTIYRLPDGGSDEIRTEIRNELSRRGFTEMPYNAETNDRAQGSTWQSVYDTSLDNVHKNSDADRASVLHFHDSADDYTTVLTAEDVINGLAAEGYSFAALDSSVRIP